MPYPNEHSARLHDPKRFEPKSFRRTDGGILYGKIKVPKTIAIIWGKLKGKAKPSDPPIAQALRFPTKYWTADKAKSWLKKNKIKYLQFEPAAKPKIKQTDRLERFKRQRFEDPKDNPFVFSQPGTVEFVDSKSDGDKNHIRLTLYDGSIVRHWYWGNLAFELSTMKMAKKRNPVLYSHDINQRIGYADKDNVQFEPKFVMEGELLKNSPKAQEVKNDMVEKFPFEASLAFDPQKSNIEFVKDGDQVEVNGKVLKGPGTVIRDTVIKEGSICVFGALKNTKSQVFEVISNQIVKENIMSEKETETILTMETFAADYPELHQELIQQGKAEGRQEALEQFKKISEVCGEDHELAGKLFAEGKTRQDALEARNEKLKEQLEEASKQNTSVPAAAGQEFTDEQTPDKDKDAEGKPATWEETIKQQMKETSCSEADAVRFCVGEYPELHKKMLDEQPRGKI